MMTLENELHQEATTTLRRESFGEVGLSVAVVLGTMAGAVAGGIFGAEFGTDYTSAYGILGATLGGAVTAGAWVLFEHLRASFVRFALTSPECERACSLHLTK
jgi:hypothetical protein